MNSCQGLGAFSCFFVLSMFFLSNYALGPLLPDQGTIALAENENFGPMLMSGSVSPERGRVGSSFTFQVVYINPENVPPVYVYLKLDNFIFPENLLEENYITFSMDFTGGDYTTGAIYSFTWKVFEEYIGPHIYYFEARVGDMTLRFPENDVCYGPVVLGLENNQPPVLSGSVSPQEGTAGDVFEYTAIYWDNEWDPPQYVSVYIDGVPHPMAQTGGDYENGLIYTYSWRTTIADAGHHTYYFRTSDGVDNVSFPENGFFEGPFVAEPPPAAPNRPPSLSQGTVYPEVGYAGEKFTFEVTYMDPDGDPPSRIEVTIDNARYGLEKIAGDPENGARYRYVSENLTRGTHLHYFEASDGRENARFPQVGVLTGPVVTEPSSVFSYVTLVILSGLIVLFVLLSAAFYVLRRKHKSES
jgi:hypothetical protein